MVEMNTTKDLKRPLEILQSSFFPNYLGVLDYLRSQRIGDTNFESLLYHYKARNIGYNRNEMVEKFKGYHPVSAIEYIVKTSVDQEIFAINEHHMNHENRIFMELLLEKLYQNGFRNIFVEGINADLTNIHQVSSFIGYYTLNPSYASFLRKALELGFIVNSYESSEISSHPDKAYRQSFRDYIQAENIVDKIHSLPSTKSILYAGSSHIEKSSGNGWKKTVQYLSEILLGKKIYCADQSKMGNVDLGKSDYFNFVNDEYALSEPSVFLNDNGDVLMDHPQLYDIQIFFPKSKDWYSHHYLNISITLDARFLGMHLLLYRKETVYYQSIPEQLIEINSEIISLFLREEYSYVYFIADGDGDVVFSSFL